jgi:hypothetical protein
VSGRAEGGRFLARVWQLVDHWAETIGGEGSQCNAAECSDAERQLPQDARHDSRDVGHRRTDALNTSVSSLVD